MCLAWQHAVMFDPWQSVSGGQNHRRLRLPKNAFSLPKIKPKPKQARLEKLHILGEFTHLSKKLSKIQPAFCLVF